MHCISKKIIFGNLSTLFQRLWKSSGMYQFDIGSVYVRKQTLTGPDLNQKYPGNWCFFKIFVFLKQFLFLSSLFSCLSFFYFFEMLLGFFCFLFAGRKAFICTEKGYIYIFIHIIFQMVDAKTLRSRWNSCFFLFFKLFVFIYLFFFRTHPVKMIWEVRVDLTKDKTMKIIVVYVEMVANYYVVILVPKFITYIATYRSWQIYQGRASSILNFMCHFVICIFEADYRRFIKISALWRWYMNL